MHIICFAGIDSFDRDYLNQCLFQDLLENGSQERPLYICIYILKYLSLCNYIEVKIAKYLKINFLYNSSQKKSEDLGTQIMSRKPYG